MVAVRPYAFLSRADSRTTNRRSSRDASVNASFSNPRMSGAAISSKRSARGMSRSSARERAPSRRRKTRSHERRVHAQHRQRQLRPPWPRQGGVADLGTAALRNLHQRTDARGVALRSRAAELEADRKS